MDDMGFSSRLADTLTGTSRKNLANLLQTTFSAFPPQVAVYKKLVETLLDMYEGIVGDIKGGK